MDKLKEKLKLQAELLLLWNKIDDKEVVLKSMKLTTKALENDNNLILAGEIRLCKEFIRKNNKPIYLKKLDNNRV